MPRRSPNDKQPSEHIAIGEWPDGVLDTVAPAEARYAQCMARALKSAAAKDSVRGIAHRAGLGDAVIRKIISGQTYPDLRTVARLEEAAGVALIPAWRERQPRLAPSPQRPGSRLQQRLPLGTPDGNRPDGTMRAIEICAGAGGQAIGLEQAGFEHVVLVENDRWACETLRTNRPEWKVVEQDVRLVDWSQYRGPVDLLAGGVPCPPFSAAGKQLGSDDERDLFPMMLDIARIVRPKAVMVENVRGLLSPKFDGYRDDIERQLSDIGYVSMGFKLLHASDFGVPQLRPRTLLVALLPEFAGRFMWPEGAGGAPTVGETLLPLMKSNGWRKAELWATKADQIAPTLVGGSKKHGGPDLGPTRAREAWRRLGVDGIGVADAPPEPSFRGLPKITVPMAALVQGFPSDWQIAGRKTHAYRQVGNAFPPPVAFAVGSAIAAAIAPCRLNPEALV
jgi:DNA (cytosine-5)-methyltransferase 1